MDQTAPSPTPPSGPRSWISRPEPSPSPSVRNRLRSVGLERFCPNRNGESLLAVPGAGQLANASKADVLAHLRAHIATLERGGPLPHPAEPSSRYSRSAEWTLGAPDIDQRIGAGLDPRALHEVKAAPQSAGVQAGDWAAALGFTLRLAARRVDGLKASSATVSARVLWCWPTSFAREFGAPYGPGLAALGFEPSMWLFAETARASDALWAMEEGLRSQSLALVIGVMDEVELTPARRLSLAAAECATPCLLVTDPRLSPAASTATRWRVGARASAVHPFDISAPGAWRYGVALERCRHRPLTCEPHPVVMEWSDETHRFRVAAAVADRADAPRSARARS